MSKQSILGKFVIAGIAALLACVHPVQVLAQTPAPAQRSASRTARVNLNTANRDELESLPGVGPATVNAIIAARPFTSIEDLKRVDGIGDVRFAELKNKVTVSPARVAGSGATNANGATRLSKTLTATNHSIATARSKSKAITGKVNINTASKEQLDALPGIGPVKSQAIINGRPFKTPEEIKKIRGIKEGEYAKIRDLITVQ